MNGFTKAVPAVTATTWASLLRQPGPLLRYLYFIRFSLLTWLALLLLPLLDLGGGTMTRGILTPFNGPQWAWSGFAVALAGWFALLAARITCAYGEERFGEPPPDRFSVDTNMSPVVFWAAQIPGAVLLLRVAWNASYEGEGKLWWVLLILVGGFAGGAFFWFTVAVLYHWTTPPPVNKEATEEANKARALMVPRFRWLALDRVERLPAGPLQHLHRGLTKVLCKLGKGYEREPGVLHGGHWIATLLLLCAIALYVLLMPVTAPSELHHPAIVMHVLAWICLIYLVLSICRLVRRPSTNGNRPEARASWQTLTATGVLAAILISLGLLPDSPYMMPVLAILVMMLAIPFWILAGLAFCFDRLRVPVLTTALCLFLLANLFPQEHLFHVDPAVNTEQALLPNPADILYQHAYPRGPDYPPEPLIVVAGSGGGIHAATWTASVLAELERQMDGEFHKHLLLISSVSGSSIAAYHFLREYYRAQPFGDDYPLRATTAARCSSLQAVAWGMAYPDALRALAPFVFEMSPVLQEFDRGWALELAFRRNEIGHDCYFASEFKLPPPGLEQQSGEDVIDAKLTLSQLAVEAAGHDGTNTLLPAFAMNSTVVETGDRFVFSNYGVPNSPFHLYSDGNAAPPAEDFLSVFGRKPCSAPRSVDKRCAALLQLREKVPYADLPLVSAARLSAAFTYVSSATRIPYAYMPNIQKTMLKDRLHFTTQSNAFHIVDGGYFDNDGVSTAIEFLKSAFVMCAGAQATQTELADPAALRTERMRKEYVIASDSRSKESELGYERCSLLKRIPILFIEIRDSDDIDTGESPDSFAHQAQEQWSFDLERYVPNSPQSGSWGALSQLLAPPRAAINAGFRSATLRNRGELDLLRAASGDTLRIHPIVLDYRMFRCNQKLGDTSCPKQKAWLLRMWDGRGEMPEADGEMSVALSWHLTARQAHAILGLKDKKTDCWIVQPAIGRYDGLKQSDQERIHDGLLWLFPLHPFRAAVHDSTPFCPMSG